MQACLPFKYRVDENNQHNQYTICNDAHYAQKVLYTDVWALRWVGGTEPAIRCRGASIPH